MKKNSTSLFVLCLAAASLIFPACNKLSKATYAPSSSDSVSIKSNVIVVDSTTYNLVSSTDQLNQGVYVYNYGSSLAAMRHNGDFSVGTIIIGLNGEGYLRKITSVSAESQSIIVNTTQARLEDVFYSGRLSFTTGFAGWNDLLGALDNSITSKVLFDDGTCNIRLTNGLITLNPEWNYNLQFGGGKLTNYSATSGSSKLSAYLPLSIVSSGSTSFSVSDTLRSVKSINYAIVGNIPVVIATEVYVIANVSGSTSGAGSAAFLANNNSTFNQSTVYSGGAWQSTFNFTPTSTLTGNLLSAAPTCSITCNIVPSIKVKLYGVTASDAAYAVNTTSAGTNNAATGDWDFTAAYQLQTSADAYSAILGYSLTDFNYLHTADSTTLATPYLVTASSGNYQTGTPGQYLTNPIVVKVTDNKGKAQPGVKVYFRPVTGGGAFSTATVVTDANGLAAAHWQMGASSGAETATATVKKGNETQVSGSPVTFTAY